MDRGGVVFVFLFLLFPFVIFLLPSSLYPPLFKFKFWMPPVNVPRKGNENKKRKRTGCIRSFSATSLPPKFYPFGISLGSRSTSAEAPIGLQCMIARRKPHTKVL